MINNLDRLLTEYMCCCMFVVAFCFVNIILADHLFSYERATKWHILIEHIRAILGFRLDFLD